jgi:tetratricopeptide (TPR) repeat protein
MRPIYLQIVSIVLVALGLTFIGFVYSTQPRSVTEVGTKGQVAIGTYKIDEAEFGRGVTNFRLEDFAGARAAFDRADPEKRDPNVQYYVAYSFYRQGWGRVSNDDDLFRQGLAAIERVIALDPNYRTTDQDLQMKTPSELKMELDEGLKLTASDLNPLRLTRERK